MADLILVMISVYICYSVMFLLNFSCFLKRELNLFLMECSLRFLRRRTRLAHFLPCSCTYSNMSKHSSRFHIPFTLEGSRWLFQRYRHCLGDRKKRFCELWKSSFDTSCHFILGLRGKPCGDAHSPMISLSSVSSSSCQFLPRLPRCRH
jgi:hypothetical protein